MNIMIRNFNGKDVRITDKDGNPWFVAKDVCEILGINNTPSALGSLDRDEKNTIVINDGIPGNPRKSIISESGLYSLILRSRKPEAKEFKRWVTHEVLPSIRKDGGYLHTKEGESPDIIISRALILAQKTEVGGGTLTTPVPGSHGSPWGYHRKSHTDFFSRFFGGDRATCRKVDQHYQQTMIDIRNGLECQN